MIERTMLYWRCTSIDTLRNTILTTTLLLCNSLLLQLFSELDLNDLESRWEAEYHATKTDYDVADVDVVHDGDGAEEEGGLGTQSVQR